MQRLGNSETLKATVPIVGPFLFDPSILGISL
jgi:hypothetical protein